MGTGIDIGVAQIAEPLALSYRIIRRDYQPHGGIEPIIVDHYAKLLSPFFTIVFVRLGVIPNIVTVLMMASGIVGAALFALPMTAAKVSGIIFIHLWYVLDCSDGEVARITRRFSKMGTEIDYTAHLVCHPLFNLAFAWNLISLHRYNTELVLFLAVIGISAELMLRNLIALRTLFEVKVGISGVPECVTGIIRLRRFIAQTFYTYPNFCLLVPILLLLDLHSGLSSALMYLLVQTSISALAAAWGYVIWIRRIAFI